MRPKETLNMTTKYDRTIQEKAAELLPPWVDWRLLKAQLMAESNLDPKAESKAGAVGLAQFMLPTWREYLAKAGMGRSVRRTNAKASIHLAAMYMAELRAEWSRERSEGDRHLLALASYNAGLGNLLEAQKAAGNPVEYAPIAARLDEVTGKRNANQTRSYVKRVLRFYVMLLTQGA